MRSYLLRHTDKFMNAMDCGSKVAAWIAGTLAVVVIIIPAFIKIISKILGG